ncbi:hypothetical protein J0X19_13755 [Hymenobacter sp. BT186]|uniref:DUF3108 domain-containing protein n=1 Tax=Hymenobacter telluris TaxID=2816474 RepID=A0A939J9P1_9BACT|nr:hypothetical protein [Hymenobacter telluris]MBO0359019.1 hypothetical protein [Hymenobacter telluris]MBW3375045.1 hypothetical protein [Hymenobacter norwichensis]
MLIPPFRTLLLAQALLLPPTAMQAQNSPVSTSPIQPAATPTMLGPTDQPAPAETMSPFNMADNMELTYRVLNGNGKPTGELRQRVVTLARKEREESKDRKVPEYTATLKSGLYNTKNGLVHLQDLTFRTRRDTCFTDGLADLNTDALRSFRDRKLVYNPTPLAWPNTPTVGSTLPPGGISVQVSSSVVSIATVSTTIRKRKVVSGPTPLKTPAGTFSCYKVESARESATVPRPDMALRTNVKQVDFYAPGVGIVRTEIYNKSGKLDEVRELASRNAGQ